MFILSVVTKAIPPLPLITTSDGQGFFYIFRNKLFQTMRCYEIYEQHTCRIIRS